MYKYFYPDMYSLSIYDIPYHSLRSSGIKHLLFDADNTVCAVGVSEPGVETAFFFCKLRDMGFNICILSNGKADRVARFAKALDVPFVAKAKKPLKRGANLALAALGAGASETAVIGDQIFTDIWCGKRHKCYTVLVKPISDAEEWYIKLKRFFETFVLNEYERTGRAR